MWIVNELEYYTQKSSCIANDLKLKIWWVNPDETEKSITFMKHRQGQCL